MADAEKDQDNGLNQGHVQGQGPERSFNESRPSTAHRIDDQSHDKDEDDVAAIMKDIEESNGPATPRRKTPNIIMPSPDEDSCNMKGITPGLPPPPIGEASYFDAATIDATREPEESFSAARIHEHLGEVESSFLPALSPIPTGSATGNGGADDTYLFDSPNKKSAPPPPARPDQGRQDIDDLVDVTNSSLLLQSSPTAAAAARTASRASNKASNQLAPETIFKREESTQEQKQNYHGYGGNSNNEYKHKDGKDADDKKGEENDDSFLSSNANRHDSSIFHTRPYSERVDAGSTPGHSLRNSNFNISRRPKYLNSRFGSSRSSTSSFDMNPDETPSENNTAGMGADFALQTGGAASAMPNRNSDSLARSISFGSMTSGIVTDEFTDHSLNQLGPLPEVDSPNQTRTLDLLKTPKPSRENLNTAPTDTVIARHVRNVQVPESLAKEYKFKGGLETPRHQTSFAPAASTTTAKSGRNLTLKEQSSTIERLSKENFDLKLKVMFLSDRLDKLSEEGIKEMISENVELKTGLAVLQRDNRVLRRRVKELERQAKDEEDRPSTARSGTSSTEGTAHLEDDDAQEREAELMFLRERVEEYATEIERLRGESMNRESEKRKLADIVRTLGERTGDSLGRQEEADVWKDLLEQETARREQADDENRRLRDEVFRLKQEREMPGSQGHGSYSVNNYNMNRRQRDQMGASPNRPMSRLSNDFEGSNGNFSMASTLVEELRRESEQLRHENAELRREVGAQTSMLTSRNREKERLYQEIEDLKMAQRRGGPAPSTIDSLLERSASRAGGHERPHSRGSGMTRHTHVEEDEEREELENKLAETRDKLSEIKLQNQELQRELESCMQDFEAAVSSKREAEEAAMTLQEDLDNTINDLVALQSERDEALREHSELEVEFEALRGEAQEEIDALEGEADQRNEELQRIQMEIQERSENFEALQEEMRKMSESLIGLEDEQENKLRRIQQLEQELEASNKESEELEQKLVEANDKNQRLSVQQESSQGEIAFLREEQEGDKIRIGDLEAALSNVEQSLRDEKDRARELEERLQRERRQREIVADQEKEEVQQFVNELNREASSAKDENRRLRKSLTAREVEAAEWKERLMELENNLREALGDLNGTRSSLLKSIAKLQRELENTIRELDTSKASLVEKDRIIHQRDSLLESHALESRKLAELLEKERVAHRNTKSQYETFQKTHQHLTRTASTQDLRINELETDRNQNQRKIAQMEQSARDKLQERNELLLLLWQKLSALCGKEWANSHTLIDRQVLPTLEVVSNRLPGFSKNLMAAVKAIESIFNAFQQRIKSIERDLYREYQTMENNLDAKTKKLDRLETMVRNSIATGSLGLHDYSSRMTRLEEAYRQLKVENATLRTANDVRARASYGGSGASDTLLPPGTGSPSPSVPRGPGEQDKDRPPQSLLNKGSRASTMSRSNTTSGIPGPSPGGLDVALSGDRDQQESPHNDNKWLLRLRDMEYKLKMEREGRNQDRQAARQRLGGLELENRDLRGRVRRTNGDD